MKNKPKNEDLTPPDIIRPIKDVDERDLFLTEPQRAKLAAQADGAPVKRGRGRPKGCTIANGARPPRRRKAPKRQYGRAKLKAQKQAQEAAPVANVPAVIDMEPITPTIEVISRSNAPKSATKLTQKELDAALDRVLTGARLVDVAADYGCNPQRLALQLRKYARLTYLKSWQRAVAWDCMRIERIIRRSFVGLEDTLDGPKWAAVLIKALEYRAKVLGYDEVKQAQEPERVAGLTQEELMQEIVKQL